MAKTENLKSNSSKDPSDSYSLEKFRLYETRARFYLIGSDRNKQFFRVLKIDRMEPSDLNISEDPVVYPPQEVKNLLQRIAEGNRATGGLNFVAKVYGIAETELTPEQRLMVETILKSSNPLATLINDVLDLSRLEDGSLQLDIRTSNLHALFREVKDTGSGINPQDIPKLFCKFAENQALGSKSSGGTGLGLAISKRFVNLMEGHIWIESEGLGKGSTAIFIVKLGIPGRSNEPKLPFMPRLPANHMQMTFQGLKVLVMDDNGLSNTILREQILNKWLSSCQTVHTLEVQSKVDVGGYMASAQPTGADDIRTLLIGDLQFWMDE